MSTPNRSKISLAFSVIIFLTIALGLAWHCVHGTPLGSQGWSYGDHFLYKTQIGFPYAWQTTEGSAIRMESEPKPIVTILPQGIRANYWLYFSMLATLFLTLHLLGLSCGLQIRRLAEVLALVAMGTISQFGTEGKVMLPLLLSLTILAAFGWEQIKRTEKAPNN